MQTRNTDQPTLQDTALRVMVVATLLLSLWFIYNVRFVVADLLVAAVLASAIFPVTEKAGKRGIPRIATVLLTYMAGLAIYTSAGFLLARTLIEQAQSLWESLPHIAAAIEARYTAFLNGLGLENPITFGASDFRALTTQIVDRSINLGNDALTAVFHFILVLILTGYLTVEGPKLKRAGLRWLPHQWRAKTDLLTREVSERMGGYVRGQFLVCTAVAAFLCTSFSLIGLPYALIVGLLGGLLNIVPFVGSFSALCLAVLIAANQGWVQVLLVI